MTAIVNTDTCDGCGECTEVCPVDAVEVKDGVAVVNEEECSDCGACQDACPTESITVE